jgi:hypothetical protein
VAERHERMVIIRRYWIAVCVVLFVAYAMWFAFASSRIPDQKKFKPNTSDVSIPIPPRPGTNGIRIIGPLVEPNLFGLVREKNVTRSLDLQEIQRRAKGQTVDVYGLIDPNGQLKILKVIDHGAGDAGKYIRQGLLTWRYTAFMEGPIELRFQPLEREGKQLKIDVQKLKEVEKYKPVIITNDLCSLSNPEQYRNVFILK